MSIFTSYFSQRKIIKKREIYKEIGRVLNSTFSTWIEPKKRGASPPLSRTSSFLERQNFLVCLLGLRLGCCRILLGFVRV